MTDTTKPSGIDDIDLSPEALEGLSAEEQLERIKQHAAFHNKREKDEADKKKQSDDKAKQHRLAHTKKHYSNSSRADQLELLLDAEEEVARSKNQQVINLSPGNEFPTLLTRLPIFLPHTKNYQADHIDRNTTVFQFDNSYGSGKRLGPPLTVGDEDVFIALLLLRRVHIVSPRNKAPDFMYDDGNDLVKHDEVLCSLNQIVTLLGIQKGGTAFKRVKESLRALAATTFFIDQKIGGRYVEDAIYEKSLKLISLEMVSSEQLTDGLVRVRIHPAITKLLHKDHPTYVNWNERKQLTNSLAKALHRFLSSQSKSKPYTCSLKKMASFVGYIGETRRMKKRFTVALNELVETGFLKSYKFEGTGSGGGQTKLTIVRGKSQPSTVDIPAPLPDNVIQFSLIKK